MFDRTGRVDWSQSIQVPVTMGALRLAATEGERLWTPCPHQRKLGAAPYFGTFPVMPCDEEGAQATDLLDMLIESGLDIEDLEQAAPILAFPMGRCRFDHP